MLSNLLIGIFISILVGALIGTQREINQQKNKLLDFAGFRTFTLVSLFGYLVGYLSFEIFKSNYLVFIGILGIFLLVIIAYHATTKVYPKEISAITEVGVLITFLLGILISLSLYIEALTIAIVMTSILFLGNALHKFTKKLNQVEIFATLKFSIISIVILPLLPNKNYTPLNLPYFGNIFQNQTFISKDLLSQLDVFNFYYIWLMVVFISGIAYVGYILMKTIGAQRGIMVTGFLGGLMSSTALTSSFSIESRKLNYLSIPLIIGVVIACSTMFFRIIFEVGILNPNLLLGLTLSLGIMGLVGFICAYYIFKKTKLNTVKKLDLKSPFSIIPALKFAIFFLIIIFISKLFTIIFGERGIYIISFLSGIADVDAITISLSKLALSGSISNSSAQIGILIAAFSNTIFKGGIAYYLGSKKFFKGILIVFSIILISGILSILFL